MSVWSDPVQREERFFRDRMLLDVVGGQGGREDEEEKQEKEGGIYRSIEVQISHSQVTL